MGGNGGNGDDDGEEVRWGRSCLHTMRLGVLLNCTGTSAHRLPASQQQPEHTSRKQQGRCARLLQRQMGSKPTRSITCPHLPVMAGVARVDYSTVLLQLLLLAKFKLAATKRMSLCTDLLCSLPCLRLWSVPCSCAPASVTACVSVCICE
jgi:hypothetical protein